MLEHGDTYAGWAESFGIFAKYQPDTYADIAAEHDEFWAGPNASMVSAEDRKRLEELGWMADDEGMFHRYV